jgi:hypothetical protein
MTVPKRTRAEVDDEGVVEEHHIHRGDWARVWRGVAVRERGGVLASEVEHGKRGELAMGTGACRGDGGGG